MRRTERAAYRTKFYSNLSSPTRFDEEPYKKRPERKMILSGLFSINHLIRHCDKLVEHLLTRPTHQSFSQIFLNQHQLK